MSTARRHRVILWQTRGHWFYQVRAGNGKIVDASEEGLSRRSAVVRRVCTRWPDALVCESTVGRPARGFKADRHCVAVTDPR